MRLEIIMALFTFTHSHIRTLIRFKIANEMTEWVEWMDRSGCCMWNKDAITWIFQAFLIHYAIKLETFLRSTNQRFEEKNGNKLFLAICESCRHQNNFLKRSSTDNNRRERIDAMQYWLHQNTPESGHHEKKKLC